MKSPLPSLHCSHWRWFRGSIWSSDFNRSPLFHLQQEAVNLLYAVGEQLASCMVYIADIAVGIVVYIILSALRASITVTVNSPTVIHVVDPQR